jgi:hypothetical protein
MSAATGTWDLTIKTPIGTQQVELRLWDEGGILAGVAAGAQETVPLIDPVLDGDALTWQQAITKPMRLNLRFEVSIDGNTMTGTSKAGRLARSKVTGNRHPD